MACGLEGSSKLIWRGLEVYYAIIHAQLMNYLKIYLRQVLPGRWVLCIRVIKGLASRQYGVIPHVMSSYCRIIPKPIISVPVQ
eukprot:scaffold232781_cov18-Prasinocladus_malaysianus.AAC.1